MTMCAVYARKSTAQPGRAEVERSVSVQVAECRAFAAAMGWTISDEHVFSDDGVSGAEFERRERFMALVAALTPRAPFTTLLVTAVDRIGREVIECSYWLKKLSEAGVRVIVTTTGQTISLDDPQSKLVAAVSGFAAEVERDQARSRTRRALRAKAERGYAVGAPAYGYQHREVLSADGTRDHVLREIRDEEARGVQRVFALAGEGHGFAVIAATMRAEGYSAPLPRRRHQQRTWARSSVRSILTNVIYIGKVVWGRQRARTNWGKLHPSEAPVSERVERQDEGLRIISDLTWTRAHEGLARRRETYRVAGLRPSGGARPRHLLSGLLACGQCGGPLGAATYDHHRREGRERRVRVYVCAARRERGPAACVAKGGVPMRPLEAAVIGALLSQVRPPVIERAVTLALAGHRPAGPGRREVIERELGTIDAEIQRYAQAIAVAGSPIESIVAEITAREAQRKALRAELDRTKGSGGVPLDRAHLTAELRRRAASIATLLNKGGEEAHRFIVLMLVERLTITRHGRGWRFHGKGSLQPLVDGLVDPPATCGTERFEQAYVLRALEREDWNQSRTARILGVHRNTLIARLAAWGIRPPSRGIVRQGMVEEPPRGSRPAEGEFA